MHLARRVLEALQLPQDLARVLRARQVVLAILVLQRAQLDLKLAKRVVPAADCRPIARLLLFQLQDLPRQVDVHRKPLCGLGDGRFRTASRGPLLIVFLLFESLVPTLGPFKTLNHQGLQKANLENPISQFKVDSQVGSLIKGNSAVEHALFFSLLLALLAREPLPPLAGSSRSTWRKKLPA